MMPSKAPTSTYKQHILNEQDNEGIRVWKSPCGTGLQEEGQQDLAACCHSDHDHPLLDDPMHIVAVGV
jgi:hypothetical protein